MTVRLILITIFFCFSTSGYGQTFNADSCGLNSSPTLNKYEVLFIDSLLFHPLATKKSGLVDPKKGFDFALKKLAFYSCTINSNTKGRGLISKQNFFDLIKPTPKGHAGIGLLKFTDLEKANSGGYDAVILIDCPYSVPNKKELINQLHNFIDKPSANKH